MGLQSSSISLTRYAVDGRLDEPVLETIAKRLKENAISEIDDEESEKAVGWTSFENPFRPRFEGSSFSIGTYLVFGLRIDKKSIPSKIIKKHLADAIAKRLAETERDSLSRSEKQSIKEEVMDRLSRRIPATPNVYDVMWDYEGAALWFFSTQKAACEDLETLFTRTFKLNLIRLFPYTIAELKAGLSPDEQTRLEKLSARQ